MQTAESTSRISEAPVPWGISEALAVMYTTKALELILQFLIESLFFTNITLAQFGNSRTNLLASLQWATLVLGIIVFTFILISITYLIRTHHHASLRIAGWDFSIHKHWFSGAILIGIIFGIFEFYFIKWAIPWIGDNMPVEWTTLYDPDYPLVNGIIIYVLLGVILAPIAEEYLFRGFVYEAFLKHFSTSFSILLSSLAFVAWHYHKLFETPVLVIPIFAGGVIKCLVYEKSRSLIPPIIIHSLSNATLFFSVLLQR